jgi:hypothetical protein
MTNELVHPPHYLKAALPWMEPYRSTSCHPNQIFGFSLEIGRSGRGIYHDVSFKENNTCRCCCPGSGAGSLDI